MKKMVLFDQNGMLVGHIATTRVRFVEGETFDIVGDMRYAVKVLDLRPGLSSKDVEGAIAAQFDIPSCGCPHDCCGHMFGGPHDIHTNGHRWVVDCRYLLNY